MCICILDSTRSNSSSREVSAQKIAAKPRPSGWWFEEDGLFNLDEEGRVEKQQCAVAASNIIRNFSFMAENEIAMGQNRHCLETMFQCLEDYVTGQVIYLFSVHANLSHVLVSANFMGILHDGAIFMFLL